MPERTLTERLSAPWARRWSRRLLWSLGSLLLLWLLMWLALPPLLKWQLQQRGSEALGRALTIDRIDVRPWALVFDLHGLQLAGADGGAPTLSVQRVHLNLELQSLLRWAPVVDALRVESPRLRLRHLGDGRLNIDDLVQRLSAPPAEPAPDAGPPRFALFNIEVLDGEAELVDEAVGATHRLQALDLAVPFLSNLGSRREVITEPRLAFTLNGSRFDTSLATTPFAEDRETRVRLQIPDLDVQPYLAYWPRSLPMRLARARLHLDLGLDFEQRDRPRLVLTGQVGISGAQWLQGDEPLLAWDRLDVALRRVEPLERRAQVARVHLNAPAVAMGRDAQGRTNLQRLLAGFGNTAAASEGGPAPAAEPWALAIDEVVLADGRVDWRDAAVEPQAALALDALQFRAGGIAWPMQQAVPIELDARLAGTPLQLRGSASDREATLQATLGELPLTLFAPYLAQQLKQPLSGQVQAALEAQWRAGADGEPAALSLVARSLKLSDLRLGKGRQPLASLQSLDIADAALELPARRIEVARVALQSPRVEVSRAADGRWMVQDWVQEAPGDAAEPAPGGTPAPAWALRLGEVDLQGGRVGFVDQTPVEPVSLLLDAVRVRARDLQPLAGRPPAAPLSVQARLAQRAAPGAAAIAADPASLRFDGRLQLPGQGLGPGLRGRVQIQRLPLHAFVPYVADRLNLELLRADASLRGDLALAMGDAGTSAELTADAELDELRAHSIEPAEELLTWSSLQLRGLAIRIAPGEATSVRLAQTVLDDYFARVLIDEQGRINLQGLIKPASDGQAVARADGAAPAPPAPAPDIRIGPVSLVNGRVRFSDRFIQPNYTANLSDVTGSLSAFGNTPPAAGQPPELADLSLKGRAEGTAALDISGRINPLATPLAMDVKAQVRDLELPPLSPYSARYAGYGIQRGKLSVDLRYRIEPDGRLEASNQIVLNQLAFGERDPASKANLPVKLAVALLADRDGVIDINLPISGSLNDPQFRLGPIIVRLIVNLIGKAITAPFSLIANAFAAGGGDASKIDFEPGRAVLDDADRRQLDAVAQALQNRPALRVTIIGEALPEAERDGWQRERLEDLLRTEKRRQLTRAGAQVPARPAIEDAERAALLREAYRRADIPKPRNFIGIAKDIPPEEMRALLLAAQVPDEQAMRELAVARAVAVRDALLERKLAAERVFLGAPRVGARATPGAGESRAADAQTAPRVELQLAPR